MLGFISPTRKRKGSATSSSRPAAWMVAGLQEGGPGTASPRAESLTDPTGWISHRDPFAARPTEWVKCPRGAG